jgi:hypothetical protein
VPPLEGVFLVQSGTSVPSSIYTRQL